MNPNVTNKGLDTPLHAASKANDENAIDILLANGADPNPMNRDGNYPIHYAAEKGGEKIVNKLVTGNTPT
jgi:ankyrin repeat protein